MRLGKKGDILEVGAWFFRLGFALTVFFSLYWLISSSVISEINSNDAEFEIFSQRLLESLYEIDVATGRLQMGVVAPGHLRDEDRLFSLIKYPENKHIAARIELTAGEDTLVGYFSQHWYERWAPLATGKFKGDITMSRCFTLPMVISDSNAWDIEIKKQKLTESPPEHIAAELQKEILELEEAGKDISRNGVLTITLVKPT